MRCEIEINLGPLGKDWEPVAYRPPFVGEYYDACGVPIQAHANGSLVHDCRMVIRRKWSPPAWLKEGWIAMEQGGDWYWHHYEPESPHGEWLSDGLCISLTQLAFDFTPPPCDDWKQSKRRIN